MTKQRVMQSKMLVNEQAFSTYVDSVAHDENGSLTQGLSTTQSDPTLLINNSEVQGVAIVSQPTMIEEEETNLTQMDEGHRTKSTIRSIPDNPYAQ